LFHAIRDLTADSFGGWKQVTNIQAGGGLYAQRIVTRKQRRNTATCGDNELDIAESYDHPATKSAYRTTWPLEANTRPAERR
jgi:hypothetical protein